MFYRLPFPSSDELERLIKAAGPAAETNMMEFRQRLRDELNEERALADFAKGWARYWLETKPQALPGRTIVGESRTWAERNRSPTPEEGEENSGNEGSEGSGGK
jgi:hypothetical protein